MKLGLKSKFMGSFGIVLILMVIVAVFGIWVAGQLNSQLVMIGEDEISKVELTMDLKTGLNEMRRYELQALVRGNTGDKQGALDYVARIGEKMKQFDKENADLAKLLETAEGKKAHKDFEDLEKVYEELDQKLCQMIREGKYTEGIAFYNGESKKTFDSIEDALAALEKQTDEVVAGKVDNARQEYNRSRIILISVTVVAIILGLVIALILSVSITRVVNQIVALLKEMAESGGDLTRRIEVKSKDEIGELAGWFNAFLDKLHDIIGQVKQSANMVATAANETSLGNQDLSQRTEEQASSLEEISSTIEEVTASLQKSSESSGEADRNSKATLQIVHKGESVVNELHGAMQEITKGSHEIAEIIAKVNDIAFQTNLLALNAAVEAARAGEQGRGFAVVAAEVRNLAGRTAESAKEIEGLIKESINKVERGNDLMEQTANVLNEIVENTQKTTDVITEIASSMREQSAASEDIRTAVEQLNQVTQQNASLVEEIAGSSESVSNEAEEMSALVGKFKLNQTHNAYTPEPGYAAKAAYNKGGFAYAAAARETEKAGAPAKKAANHPQQNPEFNEDEFEKF